MRIGDLKIPQDKFRAIAKKLLPWGTMLALVLLLMPVQQASAGDALNFFKNYFVTGDYVAGGVGLRGRRCGIRERDGRQSRGVRAVPDCTAHVGRRWAT